MTRHAARRLRAGCCVAAALALAACAAAPTQFYTLLPPAPLDAGNPSTQDPAFQIAVQAVEVPAQVDVQTFVVREGNGRLVPVETRRWIAPLSSELRTGLIAALTQRLGVPEVSGVAPDDRVPLYRVQLSVRRFDSTLGVAARIDAAWTVRAARDARRSATCESRIDVPVAPGYEALAEGHQRALGRIADSIAQALLAVQAGKAASACIDAAS